MPAAARRAAPRRRCAARRLVHGIPRPPVAQAEALLDGRAVGQQHLGVVRPLHHPHIGPAAPVPLLGVLLEKHLAAELAEDDGVHGGELGATVGLAAGSEVRGLALRCGEAAAVTGQPRRTAETRPARPAGGQRGGTGRRLPTHGGGQPAPPTARPAPTAPSPRPGPLPRPVPLPLAPRRQPPLRSSLRVPIVRSAGFLLGLVFLSRLLSPSLSSFFPLPFPSPGMIFPFPLPKRGGKQIVFNDHQMRGAGARRLSRQAATHTFGTATPHPLGGVGTAGEGSPAAPARAGAPPGQSGGGGRCVERRSEPGEGQPRGRQCTAGQSPVCTGGGSRGKAAEDIGWGHAARSRDLRRGEARPTRRWLCLQPQPCTAH